MPPSSKLPPSSTWESGFQRTSVGLFTSLKSKEIAGGDLPQLWWGRQGLPVLPLQNPILEYCSCVWDPTFATSVMKLERVQEFGARMATGKWHEHGASLAAEIGWSPLANRRSFVKLCLCRKILEDISIIPSDVFQPAPETAARHVNSIQLYRPFVRTRYHLSSFFISVTRLWNSIPDFIVTLPTYIAFKRSLWLFSVFHCIVLSLLSVLSYVTKGAFIVACIS